jgi:uncharacterized protein DUF402
MRFEPGQTIVRRNLHPDGRIKSGVAGRVLADDEQGLLMWVDSRSSYVEPETPGQTTFYTEGGSLFLTPADSLHTILWFFNGRNEFTGWYVNLELPAVRWGSGLDIHDRALDVLVAPDRSWRWKDEDEFAERVRDDAEAGLIRAEGLRMISLAEQGLFPFNGTHCAFRPDPGWPPSSLPSFWDRRR